MFVCFNFVEVWALRSFFTPKFSISTVYMYVCRYVHSTCTQAYQPIGRLHMWPDFPKPDIMMHFQNPDFTSLSSIYIKLCSVAIPMLSCKYFSSYKAR